MRAIAEALRALVAEAPLPVRIAGGCMQPVMADGSRRRIVCAGRVWPGDVVAHLTGDGALVAHRVLAVLPGRIYTQADKEPVPDGAFPRERLVGRVDVKVRAADRLRAVLRFGGLAWRSLRRRLS